MSILLQHVQAACGLKPLSTKPETAEQQNGRRKWSVSVRSIASYLHRWHDSFQLHLGGKGMNRKHEHALVGRREPIPVFVAWTIHALTASGAVLAFLAFLAIEQERWRLALLWLAVALIVDGVDGPLARWAGVTQRAPRIDGATLDLVVDYLTYVFVPAILIYRAGLLPAPYAPVAIAAILLSSLYTFARTDMKTADNFFRGFPALWNVIAFYLFILRPGQTAGAIAIGVFSALTFAPILFVHPIRVRRFQPWLGALTALWGMVNLALLWPGWSALSMRTLLSLSVVGAGALLAVGVLRTLRHPAGKTA